MVFKGKKKLKIKKDLVIKIKDEDLPAASFAACYCTPSSPSPN